ncbi:MAG: superoxide dismutase [Candidatus Sumerlaeaceae bacterium]|jgi:Fe-Mn family superoxide dismutase
MKNFYSSRRQFLALLGGFPAVVALGKALDTLTTPTAATSAQGGPFSLPPLPYSYAALEPVIDVQTMHLHHDKHHAAYVENLNKAIAQHPELASRGLEQLLGDLAQVPENIRTAVRNHGGGHWNHTFFWELMKPSGANKASGELADAIRATFMSFENFQARFEEAGLKLFGSGWVWLVVNKEKKLEILTTPNQDTPLAVGARPVLGNDVWEHAYYLKYQNRRGEYLKAWWKVVNWDVAAANYAQALKAK